MKICFSKIAREKGIARVVIREKIRVPILSKSRQFKKMLRDELLRDYPYTRHWVDAVIRAAYSIMDSWKKRYLKERAGKAKPRVRRRFARCKITLMKVDYILSRQRTLAPSPALCGVGVMRLRSGAGLNPRQGNEASNPLALRGTPTL